MKLTGAQILLESLKKEGVNIIFGYPGGVVIDIYDEMPNHPEVQHVLVRHEQGAVHAADGYARASGKVGVALATSGPGATNTVTGIATAYLDSIPLVVFTGQVPTHLIGNDAFQEVDIVGITRPCTKHNFLVKRTEDLALTIKQAFHLARSGRPGPVLVDLPKDVSVGTAAYSYPKTIKMRSYQPTTKPHKRQLTKAFELIKSAKRPLLYVGGGVILANASEELATFARSLSMPVASSLMGLGAYPGGDERFVGMLGMHGTYAANMAINKCDVIVAVGPRFDDRVTGKLDSFAPKSKIIHVDIDPTSIRKNVNVDVPVVGDCLEVLKGLNELVEERGAEKDWAAEHADWLATIADWKKEHPLTYKPAKGKGIKPQEVVELLYELTKGEAVVCTEVGQNQMWAAQFYKYNKPRTLITSGGLGTMGFGLPAAIGAQFAHPDKTVLDIAGDGSIQMNSQELMTAVCNNLPVKIVILNNGYLGMVRQWQELFYEKNYCGTCMDAQPDFVKLAEAYGAEGYRITERTNLREILAQALASKKTAIIDVKVEPEENVYPMIPAGAAHTEMLLV